MGQPRSCHSWYASAAMAFSLIVSDAFGSVESVGWLVLVFFGSIFSARLAMIALLSVFCPYSFEIPHLAPLEFPTSVLEFTGEKKCTNLAASSWMNSRKAGCLGNCSGSC